MITQDELKKIFDYNQDTGILTWKIDRNWKIKAGSVAGTIKKDKYININLKGKMYRAHRLIWLYVYGYMPKIYIDHINGNPSDNRICNLREATNSQNMQNSRIRKDNTSGVKGIGWSNRFNKWIARIRVNNKRVTIGIFDDLNIAKEAIIKARNEIHGNFANYGEE